MSSTTEMLNRISERTPTLTKPTWNLGMKDKILDKYKNYITVNSIWENQMRQNRVFPLENCVYTCILETCHPSIVSKQL